MAGNGNDNHQVFHHENVPHHNHPQSGMSLNVHLAVPPSSEFAPQPGISGGHTPNTPEILNSIVNMQAAGGPFAAGYASATATAAAAAAVGRAPPSSRRGSAMNPAHEEHTAEKFLHQRPPMETASPTSSSSSPMGSEMGTPSSSMGVQDYRRLFIKEGLKMKVQQKIGSKKLEIPQVVVHPPSPMDQKPPFIPENLPPPEDGTTSPSLLEEAMPKIKEEDLTEEDHSRRSRRRERNKVAATKCRNKKKAKTVTLMKESDTLEAQNKNLKHEIDRLEGEKKRLMDMLSTHDPTCAKRFKEMTAGASSDSNVSATPRVSAAAAMAPPMSMSSEHFRVPAAPTTSTSKRPPSPPSLDAVQNSYGFGYSDQGGVKTEGPSPHLVMEVDHHGGGGVSLEQGYLSSRNMANSCGFPVDPSASSATGHFLGKRSLTQTYLDLDSRCIAL